MTAFADDGRAAPRAASDTRTHHLLDHPLASYYLVNGITALLLVFGLVMVLSASVVTAIKRHESAFGIFDKQLLFAAVGVAVFFVARRMPMRFFRLIGYPLLLAAFVLMLLLPFIGKSVWGATRWIAVGPIQLQPSELMKLGLLLWGADLFARKNKLLDETKHILVPFLPVLMVAWLVMLYQKDLGTTMIVGIIAGSLLWTVGTPGRVLARLGGAAIGAVVLMITQEGFRFARVEAWLNPEDHAANEAYQALQGRAALASGRWLGYGLGESRQKWSWVPHQDTDFIFAIIGEELGLAGTLLVVALFSALAYTGVRIACRARDLFSKLLAAGITAWLVGQAIINVSAVIGLVPVTGVPLPLISVGGTSLVVSLFALGMLAAIARREPGARDALAQRRKLRSYLRLRRTA